MRAAKLRELDARRDESILDAIVGVGWRSREESGYAARLWQFSDEKRKAG